MQYTLIFLFDMEVESVWLAYKTKGPNPNRYNGIGGKLEPGETPMQGAIREAKEEVGVDLTNRIRPLVSLSFPNKDVLHVFYARVERHEPKMMEDEYMTWYDAYEIIHGNSLLRLAGCGDTKYFIEASMQEL